ncbi:MAG: dethiobiotin synthase [Parachlamydia sp.]|nr:dethiobiotin synthase [Parachlamydia sp.]
MTKIIVAGNGTDVGKTIVSAILTTLLKGDYWKPVQSGCPDSEKIAAWIERERIHSAVYTFQEPLSPHHAARLENRSIQLDAIVPPQTVRPLIIESVGGVLVPLTNTHTTLDLFQSWMCKWVVVSRQYLGSINHTLLTLEMLKQRHISIAGVIFNGEPNPDSEAAILEISQLPMLARLYPEKEFDKKTIQRYARLWKPLKSVLQMAGKPSGIPIPKCRVHPIP